MEILLGKSKTGKSTYIYNNIKKDIENGIYPLLFVPSQTRQISEVSYMKNINKYGIMGVCITTISEYIDGFLKTLSIHIDEKYISNLDKKVIINKIINENKDEFKLFKNIIKKQGFENMVDIYVDLFRKNNIKLQDLENINLKDKLLEQKLKEIYFIYEKYLEFTKSDFVDDVYKLELIETNIKKFKEYVGNANIYFDGYNNFTNVEYKLIETFLKLNLNVKIVLNTDIENVNDIYLQNTSEIFEISNDTYIRLLSIANKIGKCVNTELFLNNFLTSKDDIKYLADNIFSDIKLKYNSKSENIYLSVYNNPYDEIKNIASNILSHIKNGYRYKDICIYTNNIDKYLDIILNQFFEYNMPVYADVKKSISTSKVITYIIYLLTLKSYRFNINNLLTILKLGLNDIELKDISYFENYVLEFNINIYNLKNKFKLNNKKNIGNLYDLDRLNMIRENINLIFFADEIKNYITVEEISKYIYDHIAANNILENYYNKLENIDNLKYKIYSKDIEKLALDKMAEVFDSIYKIYKESISITEFLNIFKILTENTFVKTIPPTKDSVIICDINTSKEEEKKIGYLIGVCDEELPKKYSQDILFTDTQLDSLKDIELDFKCDSTSKENMEKFNIYEAFSNIKEKLYISFPSLDLRGNATRKSQLITDIQNIFSLDLIGNITNNIKYESIDNIHSCNDLLSRLKLSIDNIKESELNNIFNEKEYINAVSIYEYLKCNLEYNKILDYIKNNNNKLENETIEKVYGNSFKSSVYKLEEFKKCPFSYYLKYILKLTPRNTYEISAMDTGSIMHEVLEKFTHYILKKGIFWDQILNNDGSLINDYIEKIYEIIDEIFDGNFELKKENIRFNIYKRKLKTTMVNVIAHIAKGFLQSEFRTYGYEIEFKENGTFLPIEIKLENGAIMHLVGKIDRIDTMVKNNIMYARVIDYKSSNKELKLDDIKEGMSLQLVTYIKAFIENMKKNKNLDVKPSGMLYFNLSNNIINLKEYTNSDETIKKEIIKALRMKGIFLRDVEIIKSMDKKVESSDEKLIDISMNNMNKVNKKALSDEEFKDLFKEVDNILKEIGNEIYSGNTNIKKSKEACKYCKYSSICRKESSF